MDKPRPNAAPLITAIVLLLLPVLYVGSYLGLVVPQGHVVHVEFIDKYIYYGNYRCGNQWIQRSFWPLEQIDRKVRPGAWDNPPASLIGHGEDRQKSFFRPRA